MKLLMNSDYMVHQYNLTSSDYITLEDHPDFDLLSDTFTLETFYKSSETNLMIKIFICYYTSGTEYWTFMSYKTF